MELTGEGNKKPKAPAQFVRMPDGSVQVVSEGKDVDKLLLDIYKPKKFPKLPKIKLSKKLNRYLAKKTWPNYSKSSSKSSTTKSSITGLNPVKKPDDTKPTTKEIKIYLNIPSSLKLPRLKKLKSSDFKQKRVYYPAIMAIALLFILSVAALVPHSNSQNSTTKVMGATNANQNKKTLPRETPSFKILYPSGSDKEIIGDLVRSTPDNVAPGYRFFDEVDGITISVTQQQLPTSLKSDTATKVATMAKDFQATNVIKINSDIIYHGLSEKTKQQSLIFTRNDLLIFIIAESKLTDDEWVGYITNLK